MLVHQLKDSAYTKSNRVSQLHGLGCSAAARM